MLDNVGTQSSNAGFRATAVAIGANLLLVIIKIGVGVLINSLSLIADGFDSVLDIITALLAYVGFNIGSREPDEDHHYGHHKIEALISIIITIVLFLSAFTILDQAVKRLQTGFSLQFEVIGLISAIFSIIVKFAISVYIIRIGENIASSSLIANGRNYRTDAVASLLVGIAMVGAYFNVGWLDTIMAVFICLFIANTGFNITKESLAYLTDAAPPTKTIEKIRAHLKSQHAVEEVHDLRIRYLAQDKLTGDVHILLDPNLTLKKAHDIAERIRKQTQEKYDLVSFIIHIEPNIPEEKKE